MSMALPVWPLLYLLHISFVWAGPLSTESLTPALASVIPTCAQSCVRSFIGDNYKTVCGPPPNFACLCVNTTPSGFTIGEGSLECLASSCEDYTGAQAASIYEVCIGMKDARPNTHAILTATPTSETSRTSTTELPVQTHGDNPSSASNVSSSTSSAAASSTAFSSKSASLTATSTSSPYSSTSSPMLPVNTLSTPRTTSLESSTKASAAPASSSTALVSSQKASHILTKPQIAGIVVASVGAAALALGIVSVCLFFRRRRSQRRYTASSFGGSKVMDSSLESTPDLAANTGEDFERQAQPREEQPPPLPRGPLRLVTPAMSSEDGWDHYQRGMDAEDIGLAVGPEIPNSTAGPSPRTPKSNRTTNSHLLPDKPTYSLFPAPLKINQRNSIPGQGLRPPGLDPSGQARASTTGPAPQSSTSRDNTSQANFQWASDPRRSISRSDPFFNSSSPPNIDPSLQAYGPQSPRTIYANHPAFRVPPQLSPADAARKPVPAHQSPSARGLFPSSNRTLQPDLPRTYPLAAPVEQHSLETMSNSNRQKHHSKKKSESSRPLTQGTFFSEDSDTTTIDEDSEDEPDHRELRPRSTLSPVAESPLLRSPFQHQQRQFQYPPVPASTSASPMRYPNRVEQQPQPDSHSSRRLGGQRAREIAGRLETEAQPSAKWKVLVNSGLEPLENSESPSAGDAGSTQTAAFPRRR